MKNRSGQSSDPSNHRRSKRSFSLEKGKSTSIFKNNKAETALTLGLFGIIVLVALAGVGRPAKVANSFMLVAKAYYRALDTRPLSPAKVLRINVSMERGPVKGIARKPIVAEAKFADLTLRLENHHHGSIVANVIDNRTGKQISRRLCQFGKSPGNTFGGTDQGFTGLIYVYHPVSGTEMQFICSQGKRR